METVYFKEGEGYLLVRSLAAGADGSASLVRSVQNGKLYVRKEDLALHRRPADPSLSSPPSEMTNARAVRHVANVYKAHGWTRWVRKDDQQCFDVTYWKYYNLGSLSHFRHELQSDGLNIPENWIATFWIRMINALIDIHEGGLVHVDPHGGNWLLETDNTTEHPNRPPRIVLADFGRSNRRRPDISNATWARWCSADFSLALDAICSCLDLELDVDDGTVHRLENRRPSPQMFSLCSRMAALTRSMRAHSDMESLHDRVKSIRYDIQAFKNEYVRRPSDLSNVAEPEAEPAFITGEDIDYEVVNAPDQFKMWRNAHVHRDVAVSTRSEPTLYPANNYRGDWYNTTTGTGRSRWTVDGR